MNIPGHDPATVTDTALAWQRTQEISALLRQHFPIDRATATALLMMAATMLDMLENSREQFLAAADHIFKAVHEANRSTAPTPETSPLEVSAPCPACAAPIREVTKPRGTKPLEPGQVVLCMACLAPLKVEGDGCYGVMTSAEFAGLPAPQRRMIESVQEMMRGARQ